MDLKDIPLVRRAINGNREEIHEFIYGFLDLKKAIQDFLEKEKRYNNENVGKLEEEYSEVLKRVYK